MSDAEVGRTLEGLGEDVLWLLSETLSIGPRVRQPSPHPFSDPSPLKLRNRSQESHLQAPSVAAILPFGWFPVADVSADMSVG